MDKSKGKKKESSSKNGAKITKKKVSPKKTSDKSTKKKKTTKKSAKDKKIDNSEKGGESNNVTNLKEKEEQEIIDKLNQPHSKKKLASIKLNNKENEVTPNEQEDLKEEEKIEEENKEKNEKEEIKFEKKETFVGTPHFYNIDGLKKELEEQNKIINEENNDQEKYKT